MTHELAPENSVSFEKYLSEVGIPYAPDLWMLDVKDGKEVTPVQREILRPRFTNLDKRVFALINLPEIVKAVCFARYSRSTRPLRSMMLRELVENEEIDFNQIVSEASRVNEQVLALARADSVFTRIVLDYGDDSVDEVGGAHLSCEYVSQLAAKKIESSRLGISFLEKSSRYVPFDRPVNGKFLYFRPPEITRSPIGRLYEETQDGHFLAYSQIIEPMKNFYRERHPKESGEKDWVYEASIQAQALDTVRCILPAALLTNIGIYGNGRGLEYLILKMYADDLAENRQLASEMETELAQVIPSFIKRSNDDKYGIPTQEFLRARREETKRVVEEIFAGIEPEETSKVDLVDYDHDAEIKVIAGYAYQFLNLPLGQVYKVVSGMDSDKRRRILEAATKERTNRRHKPDRGSEHAYYWFGFQGCLAEYRDLQRMRILTQQRQLFTTRHGFSIPQDLIQAGFKDLIISRVKAADELFRIVKENFGDNLAQYAVLFNHNVNWEMEMNLREAHHFTELRSGKGAHPNYKFMAQEMARLIKDRTPNIAGLDFVDFSDHSELVRLSEQRRKEQKLREMGLGE